MWNPTIWRTFAYAVWFAFRIFNKVEINILSTPFNTNTTNSKELVFFVVLFFFFAFVSPKGNWHIKIKKQKVKMLNYRNHSVGRNCSYSKRIGDRSSVKCVLENDFVTFSLPPSDSLSSTENSVWDKIHVFALFCHRAMREQNKNTPNIYTVSIA